MTKLFEYCDSHHTRPGRADRPVWRDVEDNPQGFSFQDYAEGSDESSISFGDMAVSRVPRPRGDEPELDLPIMACMPQGENNLGRQRHGASQRGLPPVGRRIGLTGNF